MKKILLTMLLLTVANSFSQSKNFIDQPFLETEVELDTLLIPDRVYLTITLSETDNRNRKSTEELENSMNSVLKSLNIDTERDLSLLDLTSEFKRYFLGGQNVLKVKMYSLLVRDAVTAGKVISELEKVEISNVSIEKAEYSKESEVILDLKSKAIFKSKEYAETMTKPLNQKVGKAIFISDISSVSNQLQGNMSGIYVRGASNNYGARATEPIVIEFKKIRFTSKVTVKFIIE